MYLRYGIDKNFENNLHLLINIDEFKPKFIGKFISHIIKKSIKKRIAKQGLSCKPIELILEDVDRHVYGINCLLDDSDWLVGDQLSVGNIATFVMLNCFTDSPEGRACIDANPNVVAWLQRVAQLTANKD